MNANQEHRGQPCRGQHSQNCPGDPAPWLAPTGSKRLKELILDGSGSLPSLIGLPQGPQRPSYTILRTHDSLPAEAIAGPSL